MSKEHINIVSWMATEKDPERIKFVYERLSRNYTVDNVLYIYQLGFRKTLEAVRNALGDILKPIQVELPVYKDTPNGNPWNHKDVYGILKYILPNISKYENLYINVSSGTYAIHAAWLILHAGGALPLGTKLIVADVEKKFFHEVDFPISTYLGEIHRLERENPKEPVYHPDAKSKARLDAFEKIKAYASVSGIPLLLLGERGTGKSRIVETFVKTIKKKDCVTVACGSLDSNLVESMIFGHAKGAFTGAIAEKKGLLKEADGKILFLDEIQDLPKSVQRKLVRTLQDKKHRYRPLGSNEEETANIELVCASNLPENELKEKLDPDFYDRISFYKVELPPLRECREDLLDDWRRVWKSTCLDSSPKEAPEDKCLIDFLKKSILPGNFRNLQSVAYQIIAWDGKKSIEEILAEISFEDVKKSEFDIAAFPEFENKSWQEATKFFHKALAKYACKKYKTQADAADALGCSSKTLQNSLKEGKGIKN